MGFPSSLSREPQQIRTIFVDEIQKVPELLDEIHGLIERHRVRFLLTGSSARKLKRRGSNLLAAHAIGRDLRIELV